jgi:hypothetical protein
MTTELRIERRYRGPTASGNGGWSAGVLASQRRADGEYDGPIQVTLRRPLPLDTPLSVTADGDATHLTGPTGELVAEAVDADPAALGDPVAPVDAIAARAAEHDYAGLRQHPFPECFTCGPDRADGDGLRVFPGRIGPGRVAATWTPHEAMAGADGRLDPTYVWAALDCPGGWAGEIEFRPMVLGRMTARVDTRPRAGEVHVAVGRLVDVDGRKTRTASTVYDSDGRIVGQAAHIWIAVDPAAFG